MAAAHRYEIRVEGTVSPGVLLGFDHLRAPVEPVVTVIHGPLPDQAALYGLLARLEMYGVQVLDVRRTHGVDRASVDAAEVHRAS
jgi:hypothetical protein